MRKYKRYLITAALPYANGPVHIGHLAGVYVPADIYVRFLRLKGEEVLYVCGSDEHGVPITLKAKKEGKKPQEIVDYYHNIIKKSFEDFGISFDVYSRTTSPVHYETATDFFKVLYEKGIFEEKINEQYYDEEAKQFLADRYIKGVCPKCGFEEAYGDQCERCGTSLSPLELINPISVISGSKPILKKTKHWYLPLNKYENWLREWILEGQKDNWKPNVLGQVKSWLDDGLKPRAVTRDLDWGVPLPIEGGEGKVLYVWFDAPIGYISATKELTKEWEKFWKEKDTRLIHFIGKDNIVFHCIIFPVMLKAYGEYILPDNVPANEFLNLENEKISTSRNWAVWLNEYLEDFPEKQDVLRYVITSIIPETKDSDFTWKDFQSKNNNELLAILGNFVNRVATLIHKYYQGEIPYPEKLSVVDKEVLSNIEKSKIEVERNIENFKFREAQQSMMNLFRIGNKYFTESEPWKYHKTEPQKTKNILFVSAQLAVAGAILAKPFLPFTSEKIFRIFNKSYEDLKWSDLEKELLKAGHIINKPFLLFERIEDDVIERQLNKLKLQKEKNNDDESKSNEEKEKIKYEDFQKLDLVTATILEAEKVKKTKKLLKLKLDLGYEKRTVVSGIAEFYDAEEVIGKQVVLLKNLEPRKIRGIESQGMILMAEDKNGKLVFVSPENIVNNNSKIS